MHSGVDVFMECTITRLLKDGDRVCGAFGYRRATGDLVVFARAGGRARDAAAPGKLLPRSPRTRGSARATATRSRYEAGAELDRHGVRPVPPDRHGLAARRDRACSSPRRCAARAASCATPSGERFMERYDPKRMELSTRDVVARAIYTEVTRGPRHAARRRLPRRLAPARRRRSRRSCRACTTSSWSSPASTSRARRWRSGRRATTSWAGSGSTPRRARPRVPGPLRVRASARAA